MKKFSFMALALGLFLATGNAMAAGAPAGLHDSAWLANDNVMSKTVGQSNSGLPLGSVIIWTNSGMPADSGNWRECNGQSLTGTAVCKRVGICTAPDYRGYFLRGHGGKSGALGEAQDYAINVRKEDETKINIDGLARGGAYYRFPVQEGTGGITGSGTYQYTNMAWYMNYSAFQPLDVKRPYSVGSAGSPGNLLGFASSGSSGSGLQEDITISSKAGETRPTNKAVRYLIKVN